jgi:hypothetical protein
MAGKQSGKPTSDLGQNGVTVPPEEVIEQFAEIRRMRIEEGWPGWDTEPMAGGILSLPPLGE